MNFRRDNFVLRITLAAIALVLLLVLILTLRSQSETTLVAGNPIPEKKIDKPIDIELEEIEAQDESATTVAATEKESPVETVYLQGDSIDDWHDMQTFLRKSNDASDLLIAALYAKSSGAMGGATDLNLADKLLLRAFELDPYNVLVSHQIYRFCATNNHFSACGLPYLENLARLGSSNSNVMLLVATAYYGNGDLHNALLAMKQAAAGTESNNFQIEYVEAFDKSFVKFNGGKERDLHDLAFYSGLVAAISLPEYLQYSKICKERVESQVSGWKQACREVGKNIANYGKSDLDRVLGYRLYYQYSGLTAAEIQEKIDAHRAETTQWQQATFTQEYYEEDPNPMIPDIVWQEYLRLYKQEGEQSAVSFLFKSILPN